MFLLRVVAILTIFYLPINQCNAGGLKITCAEADCMSPSEQQKFMGGFGKFLMEEVLINEEVMNVVRSIDENIEIELAYNSKLEVRGKYKNDLLSGAASMVDVRRIIVGAHPSEFNTKLSPSRKQEIISMIVFEIFNISKMLEKERQGIKFPDPMNHSTEKSFVKAAMKQEHQIFEDGKLLRAYSVGAERHGWTYDNVRRYKNYDSLEYFMKDKTHAEIYGKQYRAHKRFLKQVDMDFQSFHKRLEEVIQSEESIPNKKVKIEKMYVFIKGIIAKRYNQSNTDVVVYAEKIKPLCEHLEQEKERLLRILFATEKEQAVMKRLFSEEGIVSEEEKPARIPTSLPSIVSKYLFG